MRETYVRIAGILIAAAPVAFAAIRASTTGTDFRYFWVALVSTVSAGSTVALARTARHPTSGLVARMAIAVFVAIGASAVTSFAVGAGSAPGVLMVSCGFALCSGVGLTLLAPPLEPGNPR